MTSRVVNLPLGDRHRRAEMHFSRGMYASAREEFQALLGEDAHPPAIEAELRWRLGSACAALGLTEEADDVVTKGMALPDLTPMWAARLESVRGFSALTRGDYSVASEICLETSERLRDLGDHSGLSTSLRWLALTHLRLGDLEPAFEAAYCALAEARHADVEVEVAHAHGVLCVAFIQRGQYDAALAHGREALATATRLGHQSGIIRHSLHLSIAARLSGRLETAATHALRALATAEETESTVLAISARLAAGRALGESGRIDSARELVEGALAIAERTDHERDRVLILEDLGDLDLAAGNSRAALEKYRRAWQKAEAIASQGDLVAELGWRIGSVLRDLGDAEGAIAWIEKSLVVCERAGERKEHALALRARGLWNAQVGRREESRADLEASLTKLEALNVPYEQGFTHLACDEALALVETDTPAIRAERRRHLATARRVFERIGAMRGVKLADEAEVRLAQADGTPARVRSSAPRSHSARALAFDWKSAAYRATLEECRQLGPTSLPLLLVGDTGTGKTLLAEALHELGRGEEGEFFPVNCAAMPGPLQESELFGHRKGAFTGAEREHPGIFREAGRGTVFLDEIDKTSLEFQAKLLHVLDNREIRPVGSTRRIAVEARIVCATNRDLVSLVEKGVFLEDLHHRLACGIIEIPPLRERAEDLRILSETILAEVCSVERTKLFAISDDAWDLFAAHDWPGNVRELKSILHRAVALNRAEGRLTAASIAKSAPPGSTLREVKQPSSGLTKRLVHAEKEEITRALERAGGVRKKAAELLGISYRGLGKKMARLGIDPTRGARGTDRQR
jgi:DNA-binding NtrC family response regulator